MAIAQTAFFELPSSYLSLMADLSASDESRMRAGVGQLVSQALTVRNVPYRNRLWSDAVSLLRHCWRPATLTQPLDRQALQQHARLLEGLDSLPVELDELTREVLEHTWSGFDEFEVSDEGRKVFPESMDDRLGAFQEWFDSHLPFVMTQLPESSAEAETVIARRIGWMLDKVFAGDDQLDGQRAWFADSAWAYVRARWKAMRALSAA